MSKKTPFVFDIQSNTPVVNQIKEILESELFIWDEYEIKLPPSRLQGLPINTIECEFGRLSVRTDLEAVCKDENGSSKKLSEQQLTDIKNRPHVWRLNNLLQFGAEARHSFAKEMLVSSMAQLFLWKETITSDSFLSLYSSLKYLFGCFVEIPKLFIGFKEMKPRYDTHERNSVLNAHVYKYLVRNLQEVRKDYFSNVENNFTIDFRLEKFLQDPHVSSTLQNIEKKQERKWARDRLIFRYQNEQEIIFKEKVISEGVESAWKRIFFLESIERNRRLIEKVKNNDELKRINCEIGPLVASHMKAIELLKISQNKLRQEESSCKLNYIMDLEANHKLKSNVLIWKSEKVRRKMEQFHENQKKRKDEYYGQILHSFEENRLIQEHFLMSRYTKFRNKIEPKFNNSLLEVQDPMYSEKWSKDIWSSSNWIFTPFYVDEKSGKMDYKVSKSVSMRSDSDTFGWRIFSIFQDMSIEFNNTFYNLYRSFVHGTFGFKALFFPRPFHPNYKISSEGKIVCDPLIEVETFLSRIKSIWLSVKSSRRDFENQPESSFQTISRFLNITWNYFFRGFIPTAALAISFPLTAILVQSLNVFLGITSFVWIPTLSLIRYIFKILIFDTVSSEFFPLLKILVKTFFSGIPQLIYSLSSIIARPIVAAILIFSSWVVIGITNPNCVQVNPCLENQIRIPHCDSFLMKRIKGPEITGEIFYQVPYQFAILVIQEHLERIEILAFRDQSLLKINEPKLLYDTLYKELFESFGLILNTESLFYTSIIKKCDQIKLDLYEEIEKRFQQEKISPKIIQLRLKDRIVFSEEELKKALAIGKQLIESYYTSHLLQYETTPQLKEFWSSKSLARRDWEGLTKIILKEKLGNNILTPKEEMKENYFTKVKSDNFQECFNVVMKEVELKENNYIDRFYSQIPQIKAAFYPDVSIHDVISTKGNFLNIIDFDDCIFMCKE